MYMFVFFFKQKTAYEMRISDWSSDVCSSDLWSVLQGFQRGTEEFFRRRARRRKAVPQRHGGRRDGKRMPCRGSTAAPRPTRGDGMMTQAFDRVVAAIGRRGIGARSEEHTSELQSLMRISYADTC